jgi:oligoribonuclease NrnB/cAMP/cGMP phosphodiesterase (DHH superfamily)
MDNKVPRETMEQYMYTYLNQKYGLKSLIVEWAAAIINAVKTHIKEDHDAALFAKILKNDCDEEFRFIQQHVKDTLASLVRVMLKDKNPLKSEATINRMLEEMQNGRIEDSVWKKILDKMYGPDDVQLLTEGMQNCILNKASIPMPRIDAVRKQTREELIKEYETVTRISQ